MRKTIKATDGHILTNGTVFGSVIHLADDMDESAFHEITMGEYAAIVNASLPLDGADEVIQ